MSDRLRKQLALAAVILSVFSGLAVLGLYGLRYGVEEDPLAQYTVLDAEQTKFVWELAEYSLKDDLLTVSGWLVEPGREYRGLNGGTGGENVGVYNCVWAALLDENSEKVYRLPTQARTPETDPYPADSIDHKNCAFYSESEVAKWIKKGANQVCLAVMTREGDWYLIKAEVELAL